MSIDLGFGSSNWREEMMEYVYRRAESKGRIVRATLGEYSFEYALIFLSDDYESSWNGEKYAKESTTFWLNDYVETRAGGTNIPDRAFVFADSVPEEFRHFVGLHESIESHGKKHIEACRVDLSEAMRLGSVFPKYAVYLHELALASAARPADDETKGYFDRAIPDFTNQYSPNEYDAVEYIEMFYRMINHQ